VCRPLAPSHADACNPLLQAHPTWAQDKHEGRGFPLYACLHVSPLRAPSRADPSRLGHAATIYSSVQGHPGSKRRQILSADFTEFVVAALLEMEVSGRNFILALEMIYVCTSLFS
jgi:hypothetical protein